MPAKKDLPSILDTRTRIINAGMAAFIKQGFAATSTLEIATRAKMSKREVYAHFKTKDALFAACIEARTEQIRQPLRALKIANRAQLAPTLQTFGASILQGVSATAVIAVHRLAIGEAIRSPELARTLYEAGREENHAALARLVKQAQKSGLVVAGNARHIAARFLALLWGDLLLGLLMSVVERPTQTEMEQRARDATEAFLKLYATREKS